MKTMTEQNKKAIYKENLKKLKNKISLINRDIVSFTSRLRNQKNSDEVKNKISEFIKELKDLREIELLKLNELKKNKPKSGKN